VDSLAVLVVLFGGFWLGSMLTTLPGLFARDLGAAARAILPLALLGIVVFIAMRAPASVPDWARSFVAGHPLPFVLIGGFAMLNGLFFYLMRAPTALGRPVMDQLAGFKLYLETAESYRLNMSVPEFTAERFEALLPYAVALNVEKPWSDAFAAALQRAHPQEADPMRSYYQPAWTSGAWSGAGFGNAVASTVSSMSSALSSAVPVSSASSGFSSGGGGGGGGSGGGGGGGGGGGW